MKNNYVKYISLFALCISLMCCDNFDDEPMFLSISEADLTTTSGQGLATHRIQDAWVYADGLSIGVFELPAIVPVLSSDEKVEIDIFGGIRNNGLALSPLQYSFFERLKLNLDFVPGETKAISPSFVYRDGAKVAFLEDFEGSAMFTEDCDGDDTSFVGTTSDPEHVVYGNRCGIIALNTENELFQQATFEIFNEDDFGASQVFVEMDFKCDIPFSFAYVGQTGNIKSKRFPIVLNPTEEWTKTYIDLSSSLNGGEFDSYQLMLAGVPIDGAGTIWVDNIKLIYNES